MSHVTLGGTYAGGPLTSYAETYDKQLCNCIVKGLAHCDVNDVEAYPAE